MISILNWIDNNIKFTVEGKYYPGEFALEIDKPFSERMKYSSFTAEEMATFTHEYIHYLQDISTIQGVRSFQNKEKLFQLYFAIAQRQEKVRIPINLETCGIDNVFAQQELISIYEGNYLEKKIHHINKIVIENEEDLVNELKEYSDYSGKEIPVVLIYYNDEENPIIFGTNYIRESMAYLVEKNCFGAEERINEFPYNACEMVCRELYPDFLKTPENIVALCELALMYENSGLQFYCTLKQLKQKNIDFSNLSDLIQYLDTIMYENVNNLEMINKHINESIDFMFPTNISYMQMSNTYIKTMFEAGYKWRKENHFFITGIMKDSMPLNRIKLWMDLFPLPRFLDEITKEFYDSMEGLSIIQVPLAILRFFTNPKDGCPLVEYCRHSDKNNYDKQICESTPWQQCNKKELCPLALYFTIYGLDKKEFEIV